MILSISLAALFFIIDIMLPLGVAGGIPYIVVVLLSLWSPGARQTWLAGIASSVLTLLGFLFSPPESSYWIVLTNRGLALFGIWMGVFFVLNYKRSNNELIKSDRMFRTLFDTASEAIVMTNGKGAIVAVNQIARELFGYTLEELQGKPIELLIPEKFRGEHIKHREHYQQNPVPRPMCEGKALLGRKKGNREFPVEVSLTSIREGKETLVMALVTDITERQKMIDSLRKEKETVQKYLDIAGNMFVVIDKNQEVTLINRRGCEILGYRESEIIGKNWFDHFIPPDIREEIKKVFTQVMEGKTETFGQYQNAVLTRSGEIRLISWSNTVIKDESGQITGTLSSGKDITEQQQAENRLIELNTELEEKVQLRTQELEESQRLYKQIARNFPNGVINVFDKDLNYIFVEGMEMFRKGITGDMLIGTPFLQRIDPEIREDLRQKLMSVFEGENISFELNTDQKTYMINVVGLHDTDNQINRILMVSQNISSLKRAAEDIRQSLEKEQHLNELKSRFVSMASHEFRTPLTSVMNSVSLLSKYAGKADSEDKQLKHINRIKTSVHHLTNILNDFLSLDKLEEGKVEMHFSRIDLPGFSEEIVADLEGMTKQGQKISYTHTGKSEVNVDKQMLNNIFNNLLSNAIKYSPEESEIKFETAVNNGDLIAMIRDSGIGIPKEEQEHLFERFFRAKNAVNIQGTGLGLNIVKKYLDMAGGNIDFTSAPDTGTTFTIKIPLESS